MSTGKSEFTEAEKAAIADVTPEAARSTTPGEAIAIITAILITLTAIGVGLLAGQHGHSEHPQLNNLLLFAGLTVVVVYCWLFVALYTNTISNGYKMDLLLKRHIKGI